MVGWIQPGFLRIHSAPSAAAWYYRNRWNSAWGGDINARPENASAKRLHDLGYTHTFSRIVEGSLFETHPDWFPYLREARWATRVGLSSIRRRIPYSTTWGLNFCTSNSDVVDHAAEYVIKHRPSPAEAGTIWLTPVDAALFCECDACRALDDPAQPHTGTWREKHSITPRYITFVTNVAARTREKTPHLRIGAFAYEGYIDPPHHLKRLPSNINVDIVQYGIYSLPLSSEKNDWMRGIVTGWSELWNEPGHIGIYDWSLLLPNEKGIPIPMVTALSDRMRTWHRLGARRVGTQANSHPDTWRFNPWNFYAYGRLAWDPQESPETLISDFFKGYYKESADPMRQYYTTLESHILDNEIAFGADFKVESSAEDFPDDLTDALRRHLRDASRQANHWLIRQRVADANTGFRSLIEKR
jgi:hypothetical protein